MMRIVLMTLMIDRYPKSSERETSEIPKSQRRDRPGRSIGTADGPTWSSSQRLTGAAAFDEAGMLVARADDGGQTKRDVAVLIGRYLDALVGRS
jgi:hypothetical protein